MKIKVVMVATRVIEVEPQQGEIPEELAARLQRNARANPSGFLRGGDLDADADLTISAGIVD